MQYNCFTYGSLMSEDIFRQVTGHTAPREDAVLHHHARHPVRGEDYPAMVVHKDSLVHGILYRQLSSEAMARLDEFEGDMYERKQVRVQTLAGKPVEAWTYLFRHEHAALLLPGEWHFEEFMNQGQKRFRSRYLPS